MRRAVIVALLLGACGGGGGNGDDDGEPDANGCPSLWTVDVAQDGAAAAIDGGQLTLSASAVDQGVAITLTQGGLTGDFDVSFEVSDFSAGGAGSYLQAGLGDDGGTDQLLIAGIGTVPLVGVSAAELPGGDSALQPSDLTAATLRFARTGSTVTVTASTADATATIDATMDAEPLTVGIELGSNNGTIDPETTATIDAFAVTGAGLTADAFDCDTLLP